MQSSDPPSPSAAPPPLRAEEQRVSRMASLAFLAQMVGAVLTAFLTIFLGRALSAAHFGDFTFALSVITIATLFADLGVASSSGRFLAERRDEPTSVAAVFRTALRLKLLVSIPASVALFWLAEPLCDVFGQGSAVWAVRGCAVVLFAQALFMLFQAAFIALGKLRYNLVLATAESVTEVLASVALVLLGAGATGAAFGRATGYAVAAAVGLLIARRTIGRLRSRERRRDEAVVSPRRIIGYAGPLFVVDVAFRVFWSIDVLLIAALVRGGAPIAAFGLSMRFAGFLDYFAAAVASAVAPRMARRRERDYERFLLANSIRYLIIIQMLVTAPLLIWPDAIVHLIFGNKYPEAPAVLRALTPYVLLSGIAQITTLAVNYLGYARRRVPIAITMLTVNAVIDVTLLPKIGIVAGAIGTSAAYAVWVPAHVWLLHRYVGLQLSTLVWTTARTCLAGAAMVGVLALLGTGVVSAPVMLAGAVLGPAAYVAALFALRELTASDVAVVRRVISRRAAASA
jgi:O-antigen/teichoic acid export membrane protein